MAGRPGLDPIEEGKSFSALFVLMIAVLLVSAIWAIWDDNISRRPWKQYQVEFDRLAYNKCIRETWPTSRRGSTQLLTTSPMRSNSPKRSASSSRFRRAPSASSTI